MATPPPKQESSPPSRPPLLVGARQAGSAHTFLNAPEINDLDPTLIADMKSGDDPAGIMSRRPEMGSGAPTVAVPGTPPHAPSGRGASAAEPSAMPAKRRRRGQARARARAAQAARAAQNAVGGVSPVGPVLAPTLPPVGLRTKTGALSIPVVAVSPQVMLPEKQRTFTIGGAVSAEKLARMGELFPGITFRAGPPPAVGHPIAAYERHDSISVCRKKVVNHFAAAVPRGKTYRYEFRVIGNNRKIPEKPTVHTCNPVVTAYDAINARLDGCTAKAGECTHGTSKFLILSHVIYYLTPATLAKCLRMHESVAAIVTAHRFDGLGGTMCDGEATWRATGPDTVTMALTGGTSYHHNACHWLTTDGSIDTPYGKLAWNFIRSWGSTNAYYFAMAPDTHTFADVPYVPTPLDIELRTAGFVFDGQVYSHRDATFEVMVRPAAGWLKPRNADEWMPFDPDSYFEMRRYMALKNVDRALRSVATARSQREHKSSAIESSAMLILAEFVSAVEKLMVSAALTSSMSLASQAEYAARNNGQAVVIDAFERRVVVGGDSWLTTLTCGLVRVERSPGEIFDAVQARVPRLSYRRKIIVGGALLVVAICALLYAALSSTGHLPAVSDHAVYIGNGARPDVVVGPARRLLAILQGDTVPRTTFRRPESGSGATGVGPPASPTGRSHGHIPLYLMMVGCIACVVFWCGLCCGEHEPDAGEPDLENQYHPPRGELVSAQSWRDQPPQLVIHTYDSDRPPGPTLARVRKPTEETPLLKPYSQLVGPSVTRIPQAALGNTWHNAELSLGVRVAPAGLNRGEPGAIRTFRRWVFNDGMRLLPPVRTEPMPFEQWVLRYPAHRRNALRLAYEAMERREVSPVQAARCSFFVKTEPSPLKFTNGDVDIKPRLIVSCTPEFSVYIGMFYAALQGRSWAKGSGKVHDTVHFGCTDRAAVGAWAHDRMSRGWSLVELDYTCYDATQNRGLKDITREFAKRCGMDAFRLACKKARDRMKKGFHRSGGRIEYDDTTGSGEPDTTYSNSVLNAWCLRYAFSKLDCVEDWEWDVECYVNGDDSLIAVKAPMSPADLGAVTSTLAELGLTAVTRLHSPGAFCGDVAYCRSTLMPYADSWFLTPFPGRLITRLPYVRCHVDDKDACMRGSALGVWPSCWRTPLLNRFVQRIWALTAHVEPNMDYFKSVKWNWHSQEMLEAPDIAAPIVDDPAAVAWLYERYGIDRSMYDAAVEQLTTLRLDSHPIIPAVQIMALVDDGDEDSA